ncbi:NAD-binding protein, partial [bacterium]|nr:NAD-binding protein [bacterium]
SAVEEAIFLSDIASSVTVISNKKNFKAEQMKVDQLKEIKNVSIFMETDTISFNGSDVLSSITLKNQLTNQV